jgi:flagellar capping protein FliD
VNSQLAAGGITNVRAVADAGRIRLENTTTGSSSSFTVTALGGTGLWTTQTAVGKDLKGTIGTDPTVYTAQGDVLTATSGAASGLSVKVTFAAAGVVPTSVGTVTLQKGLLGMMSDKLKSMEGKAGRVQQARDGVTAQIDRLDDAIAAYELRLDQREITLRRKFSALETALARSQSQGSWMASSIGTMNANNS